MKLAGFDEFGRIIVDGEGETIQVHSVPLSSPVVLVNMKVKERQSRVSWKVDNILVSYETASRTSFPIRISMLGGSHYGYGTPHGYLEGKNERCPGDILSETAAVQLAQAILEAVEMSKRDKQ